MDRTGKRTMLRIIWNCVDTRWEMEKNVWVTKSLEVGRSGRLLVAFTLTAILALSIGSTAVQSVGARINTWHVHPGESIQAALDSASARDTIIVDRGVYHQSFIITKSISLVGDAAILDGSPPADGGTVLTSDAITIAGGVSGVTIKRFEIRYYSYGIQASNGRTSNINILANVIHDISIAGVNAAGGTALPENWFINGNTIRNFGIGIDVSQGRRVVISNNLADQSSQGAGEFGAGVRVDIQPDSTLDSETVTVTGNKITRAFTGIYIASMSAHAQLRHIVVISNRVSSCGDGIDILQFTTDARPIEDVVVSYNTVDNNVGVAILLQGVSRGQVLANTLTNNLGLFGAGMVVAYSSRITISRNLIRHNNVDGIEISSSNDNMVIGNTATDNGRWGIALKDGSSRNVIMSNRAKGNIEYDLFDDRTGTGNVWKLNSYDTKNW